MKRFTSGLVCLIEMLALGPVSAAGVGGASSPQAAEQGRIVGDPRGAIRALGGNSQDDFKQHNNQVNVPALGGQPGAGRVDGSPPSTTGPR